MSEFFNNLKENKLKGIFISGDEINGEYKRWYPNGQLFIYKSIKNGLLDEDYKIWDRTGKLISHCIFKENYKIKELVDS